MIIYKTTNLSDGKYYVGKDTKNNPNYLGSGLKLQRAVKKYGKENFKKEILEYCTSTDIDSREIFWIDKLNATNPKYGYNLTKGGSGGDTYTNNPNYDLILEKLKKRPPMTKEERERRSKELTEDNPMHRPDVRKRHKEIMGNLDHDFGQAFRRVNNTPATCPHCGKQGENSNTMKRWHFDNCKKLTGKQKHHPKIKCPHCEVTGQAANMKRWHFDNCKKK